MSVKMRQHVERQIARRVLLDGKALGYRFNVTNGGDDYELPAPTDNIKELLAAMFATDEDTLHVFRPGKGRPFGWIFFVYGNSGYDVISDYTTNLEPIMKGALALADKYG